MQTKSFTYSSYQFHGNHPLTQSSPSYRSQMLQEESRATRELILRPRGDLSWTRIRQSWTVRVVQAKLRARASWLEMTSRKSLAMHLTSETNTKRSRTSSKSWSKSAHIWSMIRLSRDAKASLWKSSFQSRSTRSGSLLVLSKCKMSACLWTQCTITRESTMR